MAGTLEGADIQIIRGSAGTYSLSNGTYSKIFGILGAGPSVFGGLRSAARNRTAKPTSVIAAIRVSFVFWAISSFQTRAHTGRAGTN